MSRLLDYLKTDINWLKGKESWKNIITIKLYWGKLALNSLTYFYSTSIYFL